MLLNLSQELGKKKEVISAEVGAPFNLEERQELQGTVLQELPVTAASIDLYNLMILNKEPVFCSLEMRSRGIVISFRSETDVFSLVIPFYKLRIYKGRAEEYSFYKDHYFIKIHVGASEKEKHQFIRKIMKYQADTAFPRIEDML